MKKQKYTKKQLSLIKYFTCYIWWEDKDYILNNNPLKVVAFAMRYANNIKDYKKLCSLDKNILKDALKQAQPGWMDSKSWHYWHYMLYGINTIIPPLPSRSFLNNED